MCQALFGRFEINIPHNDIDVGTFKMKTINNLLPQEHLCFALIESIVH